MHIRFKCGQVKGKTKLNAAYLWPFRFGAGFLLLFLPQQIRFCSLQGSYDVVSCDPTWAAACQAPLLLEFTRQAYWSRLSSTPAVSYRLAINYFFFQS